MKTCTFFGHRECPPEAVLLLKACIENLIKQYRIQHFLVGDSGQFDAYCRSALRDLQKVYPDIRYCVVLSRLPVQKRTEEIYDDTILPAGIENAPPRFSIDRRNLWMVQNADIVVCYVKHPFGGAYKFMKMAEKQGKTVINLTTIA